MVFANPFAAFFLLATTFINFASATPIVTDLTARQVSSPVLGHPDRYPMVCNELVLPTTEIDDCANDLIAAAKGKDKLKIEGHTDGIYTHLCQRPHVYVNARAWGELTAEADALAVGNAVKWILWTCGHKGGSMSANGDQGAKSFIVHVSDHWV